MSPAIAVHQEQRRLLREEVYVSADPRNPYALAAVDRSLYHVAMEMERACEHYYAPLSRQAPDTAARFRELVTQWRADVQMLSSSTDIAMHPAYQRIIAMGSEVLPMILRELERSLDHWFWALRAITGINPVPPAHRGRRKEMVTDWLRWARERGIRW